MATVTWHDGDDLLKFVAQVGVVPLITLRSVEEAVPLAKALQRGGAPIAEVTFRSPYAVEGMKAIRREAPQVVIVAGTVHNPEQAKASVDAGARGIVTPSADDAVLDWCQGNKVPIIPGTAVPSDVEKIYDRGLRYAKFFPAQAYGGVATLKALAGPFAEMSFLPTGGVNLNNAADYLDLPNVFAIGGSFPIPKAAQQAHDWDAVAQATASARRLVEQHRGGNAS